MPLLKACSIEAVVALQRKLALHLHQKPSKAEQRVADLLPLANVLRSQLAEDVPHHSIAKLQVAQVLHDRARPDGALAAEILADRFGGAEHNGWF